MSKESNHVNGATAAMTHGNGVHSRLDEVGAGSEPGMAAFATDAFCDIPQPPHRPERVVPRLGDYLVDMGIVSRSELSLALDVQQAREREGRPVLLGQLLVELGYIEKSTLDYAVTREIMALHSALASDNERLQQKVAERSEQLDQALAQIRELREHKDEFVGVISHEFRTPLTIVLGYLDLFMTGELGSVSPKQTKALNRMLQASNRLYEMITNVLDFADAGARARPTSCTPVPVTDLFRFAVKKNLTPARERGIRLLVGAPQPYPTVRADGKKIRWVVSELVDNAVKFTAPRGKVKLIGRHQNRERFHFLVADNGPGIPAERLDEVFEPFRQLDSSTTRQAGGMGLGLALARQIVEAHGSELEIRSRPGKGTQVGFSLPMAP